MNVKNHHKIFKEKRCCVLIPTFNNAETLPKVIKDVLQYTDDIIVVNDGSTDDTFKILKQFPEIQDLSYEQNEGKGFALRAGMKLAENLGYEYAITMNGEGQYFASDLPKFLEKINKKDEIVIGTRNSDEQKNRKFFANKFSNFWLWSETGIRHIDTHSDFRLYPLKHVNKLKYFSSKYEFEFEVIVRNAWHGIDIKQIPINTYFPSDKKHSLHVRSFKDFLRICILNTVLVFVAFFYGLPARLYHYLKKKKFRQIIKDDILHTKDSNLQISKAVGFGFFMGIVPVWGWQTILALTLSHYFKLNKAIVIMATYISIPPMLPFVLFGSFYSGALVLGKDLNLLHFTHNISLKMVSQDLFQYILGAVILAIVAAIVSGLITFLLLKIFRKKKV